MYPAVPAHRAYLPRHYRYDDNGVMILHLAEVPEQQEYIGKCECSLKTKSADSIWLLQTVFVLNGR